MKLNVYYSKRTQVHWTCKALLDRRGISPVAEIREVRCWRLGAIIHRLKSDYGWPIKTGSRSFDNVVFYSLPAELVRTALRFPPSASALGNVECVQ